MEIAIFEIKFFLVRKASKSLDARSYKLLELHFTLHLISEITILPGFVFRKLVITNKVQKIILEMRDTLANTF